MNFFIDDKLKVHLFYPETVSLYQLLHSEDKSNFNNVMIDEQIDVRQRIKYAIAL